MAQPRTLVGHTDLMGRSNPALIHGDFGQVALLYRYQWEGLGPSASTLFTHFPLEPKSDLSFRAIGTVLEHENFSILGRTYLDPYVSGSVAQFGKTSLGAGLSASLSYIGLDTDEWSLDELADPELGAISQGFKFGGTVGLSLINPAYEIGLAAHSDSRGQLSEYFSSITFNWKMPGSKWVLKPCVIYREAIDYEGQFETQLGIAYDEKINFNVGYRQDFGLILQLGIRFIKSAKLSYGSEPALGSSAGLGATHEVMGAYFFEAPYVARHRQDLLIKARRDSLNALRLAKYKQEREEELLAKKKAEEEKLTQQGKESRDESAAKKDTIPDQQPLLLAEDAVTQDDQNITQPFDDLNHEMADNTHIILKHIGFETGLYLLTPESYHEIKRLANYVKHHKSLHIEIQGHTDNSGSTEHNHVLSKYRAMAVFNYLVSHGVEPERMNVVGYGEEFPLHPNDTKENRELNRRIEILFIKK